MAYESVTFTNSRGGSITADDSFPFLLETFDPGPPKSTLITTKAPGQDGKTLEGQLLEERTPQITLKIIADDVAELYAKRQLLYSVFNTKISGVLQYTNESGTHAVPCAVEDAPTPKTRQGRSQEFLIQLYCPDPYWLDPAETVHQIAKWVGDFHFPLSIPADTGIILGHRLSNLIVNCYNPGDIDCGMRVEFTALATVVNPSILNVNTREIIRVKRTLTAGDKLVINTAFGNETVRLTHNSVETNALNYLDITVSDFFTLDVGDNILRYDAESGIDNLECAIYYTPKYMGV